MALATRLEQLVLKEISGVDDPANEAPGFAIFKAKDSQTESATEASSDGRETTIFGKLLRAVTGGKGDDLEMDRSELEGILKERDERLLAGVADVVKGLLPADETKDETVEKDATDETDADAVEKDATDESATDTKDETVEKDTTDETDDVEKDTTEKDTAVEKDAPEALTAEDVAKAIGEALAPYLELSTALLGRIEAVEGRFAGVARKSLEGQEGGEPADETPSTPTLKSAFGAALSGHKVELR